MTHVLELSSSTDTVICSNSTVTCTVVGGEGGEGRREGGSLSYRSAFDWDLASLDPY